MASSLALILRGASEQLSGLCLLDSIAPRTDHGYQSQTPLEPGLLAARAGNGMGRRFRANEVFVTTAMIARCTAWARFRPSLPRAHVWHFLLMDSTPRSSPLHVLQKRGEGNQGSSSLLVRGRRATGMHFEALKSLL